MLIVANWKTYVETKDKGKNLFTAAKRLALVRGTKMVLVPPAPLLGFLAPGNRTKVSFGAQDITLAQSSAATGEVTAQLVKNMGAEYVIVGHSERRAMGETDTTVKEKVDRVLAHKLTPIVCVGENVRDEDATYLKFLRTRIAAFMQPLSPKDRLKVVIAYEPVWAIGKTSAEAISASDLAEMVLYIRKVLGEYIPANAAAKATILYGGSVDALNVRAIAKGTGIDGLLVGRASTDTTTLTALVKALV